MLGLNGRVLTGFISTLGTLNQTTLQIVCEILRRSLLCMGEVENFSNSFCPKVPFNNLETTKAIILRRSVNSAETESYERKRLSCCLRVNY